MEGKQEKEEAGPRLHPLLPAGVSVSWRLQGVHLGATTGPPAAPRGSASADAMNHRLKILRKECYIVADVAYIVR